MEKHERQKEKQKKSVANVAGIIFFTLTAFGCIAVWSYHSRDPSLWSASPTLALNLCGRMGASFSSWVLECFGVAGFLVPFLFFGVGMSLYRRLPWVELGVSVSGALLGMSSVTVLAALYQKVWFFGGGELLTGGVLGTWIAGALVKQLNPVGTSLVAIAVIAFALEVSTSVRVIQIFTGLVRAGGWLSVRLVRLLLLVLGRSLFQMGSVFWSGLRAQVRDFSFPQLSALRIPMFRIPTLSGRERETLVRAEPRSVFQSAEEDVQQEVEVSSQPLLLAAQSLDSTEEVSAPLSSRSLSGDLPRDLSGSSFGKSAVRSDSIQVFEAAPKPKVSFSQKPAVHRGQWKLPTIEFLKNPPKVESTVDREKLIANSQILTQKFADFGIDGEVTAVRPGPVITLYEFKPGPGIKVSRIAALADDLSMALSAQSVRILAPLPGKSVVGIEIPSESRETVYLREFLQHPDFYGPKHGIPIVMGKDIGGQTYLSDLARMPHLLCAGQTGSGKSVFMNGLICSLFYRFTPDELRMILVDPKFIEFRAYQDIPHLLLPVVDDPKNASTALKWAVREMERRYRILAKVGARNLASFNQKVEEMGASVIQDLLSTQESATESSASAPGGDWIEAFELDETGIPRVGKLPFIVVIIDELADLMMVAKKDVEISIARIAQKARAAGIHLVIATQRPSTDVITGLIKANLPSRLSFQLASYVDSKTILDRAGAERLLGQGDMLFIPPGVSQTLRLHGAFLDDDEIQKIAAFLKNQGKPAYRDEILMDDGESEDDMEKMTSSDEDPLYQEGVQLVRKSGHASASFLQRHLKIGYNRAALMIETLEARGVVGPQDGARPRAVMPE